MPNWKKVIVSGSDASLNSLTVSNGITGSLFGTASFATSASYALTAQTLLGTVTSASFASTASFVSNAFIQNGNSFGATAVLGTNDTQNLVLETSGSTRLFISSSGNVGVGITTPSASLHVAGDIRLASAADGTNALWYYRLSSNNWSLNTTNGVGEVYRISGNSQTFYQVGTFSNSLTVTPGGNSTTQGLVVTSGSYPAATLLRVGVNALVVTGSNVGIGTTAPIRPFHIKNTATTDASKAYMLIDADGTVDGAATLTFSQNNLNWQSVLSTHTSAGGVNFGLQLNDGGTATFVTNKGKMFVGNTFTIPSASLHAKGSGTTSASIALLVENSSRSTLLSVVDNGFVGIGITAPSYSLDVSGSGRFTNSIIITGSLQISASIFQYSNNASITTASIGNIASFPTSSYQAGFFDYVASSGTNARAGTIFTVWNGSSIEFSETATNDIGLTNNLILSASLSSGNILLQGRSLSGSWSVKTLTRMI